MVKEKIFESLALIISTVLTITIAIGLIRYYAPHLLGLSSDVQLVKTSKKVPPFFEGVFRNSDYDTDEYIIPDPFIKRAKPLFPNLGGLGPNDLLGFRNRFVPNVSDIVIIGDSQTYGNNAILENNWPNLFIYALADKGKRFSHYEMAVGGWGAIEYLEIFYKSLYFQPKVVIVAFYSGNDPLETFRLAYSNDRWNKYQVDKSLSLDDLPYIEFPPPKEDLINIIFKDQIRTTFAPKNRLYSNEKNKVVMAGYNAMLLVAKEIAKVSVQNSVIPVFTIIPTKELVYVDKVRTDNLEISEDYSTLVENEQEYIDWFSSELSNISGAQYINVVNHLQETAIEPIQLYLEDANGHPIGMGYKVIADKLASSINLDWKLPDGLVALFTGESKYQLGLIRDGNYWQFVNSEIVEANGWSVDTVPQTITLRDIVNHTRVGFVNEVNQEMFGPRQ